MSVRIINEMGDVEVKNSETGAVEIFSEKEYIKRRSDLLQDWLTKQAEFETAKNAELEARKKASDFMHDAGKSGKQETVKLGNGYEAKLKVPIRYNFIKDCNDKVDKCAIEKALAAIAQDGSAGQLIAERLVKWSPDLSLTEYKILSDKHKAIINTVIVTKEGTPVLSIKEPKA